MYIPHIHYFAYFISLLGENVVGLRSLLYEVFRHIQNKADREDIRSLIAAKLSAMEKEMVKREEEMLAVASTARCMSCGQKTVDRGASGSAGTPGVGLRSAPRSPGAPTASLVLDDDLSETTPMAPYSAIHQEGVYSLLTGQGGLKPLHLQHNPLPPVQNPYPSHSDMRASTSSGTRNKKERGAAVPDLSYRKARLSQHVKEMVKVSVSSLQTHGFDLNANPLYVLDGQEGGVSRVGLASTDPGTEPPLVNPFNDLAQPLSFSFLPKSANGATAATMMNSRSSTNVAATRAPRTAGNVLSSSVGGEGLQISTATLHNGYL
ncbi:hypothetical protein EON65_46070 [archaeon]|nr:MAG: hypothetical protein EON65_46070 [archaeon]